jgi:L-lactate dehydrogenase
MRDVTLSLPRLIGGSGVLEALPLPLDGDESRLLQSSACTIRQAIVDLEINA